METRAPILNSVLISGNLTEDPNERILENGTELMNFRMANNLPYRDRQGEWKDKVCYVSVSMFGKSVSRLVAKLHKGSPVVVEGTLAYSTWESQDGGKRSEVKIQAYKIQALEKNPPEQAPRASEPYEEFNHDDIPF